MRKTNEEFAAEVLRRSADYRRKRIIRRKQFTALAACLVLLAGGGTVLTVLHGLRTDQKGAASVSSADDSSEAPRDDSVSDGIAEIEAAIRIETEQPDYPAGTVEIPVTVTNQSKETVSVHPYQFEAVQGDRTFSVHINLPEEALRPMTVTVQPGTSETLLFPAAEYLHGTTGHFTLRLLSAETEFDYGN